MWVTFYVMHIVVCEIHLVNKYHRMLNDSLYTFAFRSNFYVENSNRKYHQNSIDTINSPTHTSSPPHKTPRHHRRRHRLPAYYCTRNETVRRSMDSKWNTISHKRRGLLNRTIPLLLWQDFTRLSCTIYQQEKTRPPSPVLKCAVAFGPTNK